MEEPATRAELASDQFTALWRRLKDHRIAQWTVGYVAVAYGIQHAVTLTSEALDWPHAITRLSFLLLALGMPIAMTLAWYHGERVSKRASGAEMAIISILLVIASLGFYGLVRPANVSAPAASVASIASPANGISVAVLPFVNLSPDKDQEFFSDGMTEEITAALAQVKGMHVVGRTSAFAFKGKNEDLRTIGRSLGATHLIEGSVRKSGDRLRITAQLIKADDDSHLWAQNYDRELTDVFAIQEDIAQAIAASLQVPLGMKPGESLVSSRTGNTESYEEYLRARALFRARSIEEAVTDLQRSVARDPGNAAAWGLLAEVYLFRPAYAEHIYDVPAEQGRRTVEADRGKAEKAAHEAIRLNPKSASGYAALGYLEATRMNWSKSDDFFAQALALDPDDPDALHLASVALITKGKLKQALDMRLRLKTLEPFVPIYNAYLGVALLINGRGEEAVPILESVPNEQGIGAQRNTYLALAEAAAGHYAQSADLLAAIPADQALVPEPVFREAAQLLRRAPARISAEQSSAVSTNPETSFVYAVRGAPGRALDSLEYSIQIDYSNSGSFWIAWTPALAEARKTPRFKELMRRAGLADYWRAKGWPPQCHPTTGDDFECS